MRIVINHLTRMRHPYVCAAGFREDGSHIRPVFEQGQLGRSLLRSEGGPLSLGGMVDLGSIHSRPMAPEVEDVVFSPELVRPLKQFDGIEFGKLVGSVSKPSLSAIFGDKLTRLSGTAAAIPRGAGDTSLGVLRVSGGAHLQTTVSYRKHEIRFAFGDCCLGELSLKVTDLRLWERDHSTPAFSRIEAIQTRLQDCLVAVGLTRYWEVPRYPGFGHWLQVNNIFPIDDPLWTLE